MPRAREPNLKPFWTTSDGEFVKLYQGDVIETLRRLPAKIIQTCVTSPPYWDLRDYGTAEWEGGDKSCDHRIYKGGHGTKSTKQVTNSGSQFFQSSPCPKCAAKRIDEQIGSEATVEEFVAEMVDVFREVRRVLRDDGTVWLNLGDSMPNGQLAGAPWRVALALQEDGWILKQDIIWHKPSPIPESCRNRCTKAHEYIFLLTKKGTGYFYDQEAIREKGNESINRGTFRGGGSYVNNRSYNNDDQHPAEDTGIEKEQSTSRNKRSVWTVASEDVLLWLHENRPDVLAEFQAKEKLDVWRVSSEGYAGAHFATFPRKLITPCILAGTSEKGACVECGAPWKRIVERDRQATRPGENNVSDDTGMANRDEQRHETTTKTVGWEPTCECNGKFVKRRIEAPPHNEGGIPEGWAVGEESHDVVDFSKRARITSEERQEKRKEASDARKSITIVEYVSDLPLEDHETRPCIVLDPFCGTATANCVALAHGRNSIGIDLSADYLENNAIPRIEGELLSRPALSHLAGKEVEVFEGGIEI